MTSIPRFSRAITGLAAIAIIMLLGAGSAEAQRRTVKLSSAERQGVKNRLVELLDLVGDGANQKAAGYIAYRGPDTLRRWRDSCIYTNADEARRVDELCATLRGYLDASKGYGMGKVFAERESEGTWVIIEVGFVQPEGVKHRRFAFLQIKGQYYLGDID